MKKDARASVTHMPGSSGDTGAFISARKMVRLANHSGLANCSGLRNLKSRKRITRTSMPSITKMFLARFAGTAAMSTIPAMTPSPAGIRTKNSRRGSR